MSQPELPTLSFLEAIEPLLADDNEISPAEWLAYGKKHASNPRQGAAKAREAKAMFDLIMERGIDDFISLAESGLSSARDIEVPTMGEGNSHKYTGDKSAPMPIPQEKKEKNVSRMEDTVEALRKLKGILPPAEPKAEPEAKPESLPTPDPEPEPEHEPLPNAKYGVGIHHPHLKPTKYGNIGIASDQKLYPDLGFTWANKKKGDYTVRPFTEEEMKAAAGDNQDMFGTGPEAPTLEELKAVAGDNQDMFGTGPAAVDESKAAKTEVMSEDPEDYTDKAIEIFKDLHATEFDPKSRMDRGKLEKMKSMLADVGGIGDEDGAANKFALQFYRNS